MHATARPLGMAPEPVLVPAVLQGRLGAVAVALFLMVAAVVTYRTVANLNVPGAPGVPGFGLQDFRDAVYYPARSFLDGRNPYDPATHLRTYPVGNEFPSYLPMTLVLHLPFALLPFEIAEWVYYALSLLLILLLARVTLDACGVAPTAASVFGLGALVLASRPGHWAVSIGQCTPLAVVGTCISLGAKRERPWLAGLGLALAAFKPTFGGPLAVLLAARGDRRAVLIGVTIAAAVSAAATVVLAASAGGLRPLAASLASAHAAFSAETSVDPASSWSRIDATALVGRVLDRSVGAPAEMPLGLGLLAGGAWTVAGVARRGAAARRLSSSIACLAILACTYHQGYDLLLLVLPLVALATGGTAWPWCERPALRAALLLVLAVPAANYLASETALQALALSRGPWLVATSLNGAAVVAALIGFTAAALPEPA
jgi:hypothetical protein